MQREAVNPGHHAFNVGMEDCLSTIGLLMGLHGRAIGTLLSIGHGVI